jgi:LmbE family N-acetylglucosaminyl deacetylase
MPTSEVKMLLSDQLNCVLVIAPHADDEVLGCGGLLARLAALGRAEVHVLYLAVDGFRHYGLEGETTVAQRLEEISAVADLLGFTHEIAYADQGLMEKLDTMPARQLVELFERTFDQRRPELVLLPGDGDYDQDHRAVFRAGFAATRPMPADCGKWLVPHVLGYELTQKEWASAPLARATAYCDISAHLETKLEAISRYATQARPSPHIRSPEAIRAQACLRGKAIGVACAEAFTILRTMF